jgi:hypothetical protein
MYAALNVETEEVYRPIIGKQSDHVESTDTGNSHSQEIW